MICNITNVLLYTCCVPDTALEYACPVWHTGLTAAQSDALESVQKRAMRIIDSDDISGDYKTRIIISGVDTLKDRREVLTERFFERDMFFKAVHFFIIYSQIGVTMTLLIVSDIHNHNHSTNCGLVLRDFATVLYHIDTHTCSCKSFAGFYLLCS